MLDIKKIKHDPVFFKKQLELRGEDSSIIDKILKIYAKKNELQVSIDNIRQEKNIIAKSFDKNNIESIRVQANILEEKLIAQVSEYNILCSEYQNLILLIPNIVDDKLDQDKEIYKSEHILSDIECSYLSCQDIISAANISGSKFIILRGLVAKLERVLINKMIDLNSDIYTEYAMPVIVNEDIMYASSHLPKFKNDMFQLKNGQYLIPTGEVPLIGILKDIKSNLPIRITASTLCFRAEAGGINDGLIRTHQFSKVELVHACTKEENENEFSILIKSIKKILEYFNLPYRIIQLSNREIGFHAYKTYDFEIYMPGRKEYVEISSASMCLDFQSRRMHLKYHDEYVYTMNGSGLAIGRMIAAIIENHCIVNNQINEEKISSLIHLYSQ